MYECVHTYIKCMYERHSVEYSRPLNNMDLNCMGPLMHSLFSINTTVLHDPIRSWLNPRMQNMDMEKPHRQTANSEVIGHAGWCP